MNDNEVNSSGKPPRRPPWNRGKLIGPKPPLRPSHVWSIRTKLQIDGKIRDLALFNLAIDSKLRGCDVVAIRVHRVDLKAVEPIAVERDARPVGRPGGGTVVGCVIREVHLPRPIRIHQVDL